MSAEMTIVSKPLLSEEAAKFEFRVVARGKSRRGIRLERIFWQTAKSIAQRNHVTMGSLVDEISSQQAGSNNLASSIRVARLAAANPPNTTE